jgi:hypothetical protein
MEFKGCQRCGGDLRVEEDMSSPLEELVCLQCGNRRAAQALLVGGGTLEHAKAMHGSPWRSKCAA